MSDEKIILNEKELDKEEFDERKEELEKKKGVKVFEVKPGVFKSRLED